MSSGVSQKLQASRKELLDIGLRNNMYMDSPHK